jgi:two-component system, NtrC family, response regulator HydG
MRPEELKLFELLRIDESAGTIHFKNRRMLVFAADAMGLLRKELIDSLGIERARRILTRFSYARGYSDAITMKEMFNWTSEQEWADAGQRLHSLEGIAGVRLLHSDIDGKQGRYDLEGEYLKSYEAEQHVKHIGRSDKPVCWTLTGYATGYATAVIGHQVCFFETECVGKGDEKCHIFAKAVKDTDDELRDLMDHYKEENFHNDMERLLNRLEENSCDLATEQDRVKKLESHISYLQEVLLQESNFEEMIGASPTFREVVKQAERVAASDSTVLIYGETGTGKELLARAVHARSLRSKRPMIALNCAALPAGLVESELFGHEKGAFTGATQRKLGRFELADGATIFLDEVGELPVETQVKLLRVLQEGEFERLGSTRTIKVDVRVIAATNQPLERLVSEGKYRSDLYYRLNVFPITIPPLRHRGDDITLLTYYFAQKFKNKFNKRIISIDENSLQRLKNYSFPGNIRELEHIIERAVLISDSTTLLIDLPSVSASRSDNSQNSSPVKTEFVSLQEMEKVYIEKVLQHSKGHIEGKGGAAEILDLPPSTLRSRMKKLGLK